MSSARLFTGELRTYLLADTTLSGLILDRIYSVLASQAPILPCVVWQTISSSEDSAHDGPTGLEQYRIQFSIYSLSQIEGASIRDAIKNRINGFTGAMGVVSIGTCFFDNESDSYEETSDLYSKIIDFKFMLQNA